MRIYKLSCLAHDLTVALASGKFHYISEDDVWDHIEDSSIFEYLKEQLGYGMAISALAPIDKLELLVEWENMRDCVEPLRFDTHRFGLCLLICYLQEGIARRAQNRNYRLSEETCGAAVSPLNKNE